MSLLSWEYYLPGVNRKDLHHVAPTLTSETWSFLKHVVREFAVQMYLVDPNRVNVRTNRNIGDVRAMTGRPFIMLRSAR